MLGRLSRIPNGIGKDLKDQMPKLFRIAGEIGKHLIAGYKQVLQVALCDLFVLQVTRIVGEASLWPQGDLLLPELVSYNRFDDFMYILTVVFVDMLSRKLPAWPF